MYRIRFLDRQFSTLSKFAVNENSKNSLHSSILQSLSLPFDLRSFIHYTPLGAINFFVRITEIRSVKLVSSIANGPTK